MSVVCVVCVECVSFSQRECQVCVAARPASIAASIATSNPHTSANYCVRTRTYPSTDDV